MSHVWWLSTILSFCQGLFYLQRKLKEKSWSFNAARKVHFSDMSIKPFLVISLRRWYIFKEFICLLSAPSCAKKITFHNTSHYCSCIILASSMVSGTQLSEVPLALPGKMLRWWPSPEGETRSAPFLGMFYSVRSPSHTFGKHQWNPILWP